MMDAEPLNDLRSAASQVGGLRLDLANSAELGQTIAGLRGVIDTLEGLESEALDLFDQTDGYKDDGFSSLTAWTRRHLRLSATDARARTRAGRTARQLPEVEAAWRAGEIRLEHVKEFTAGVTKAGLDTMVEAHEYLLPVARTCDPSELKGLINKLVDVVHPERLDKAYADGMAPPAADRWAVPPRPTSSCPDAATHTT